VTELNTLQAKVLRELWSHPSLRFSDMMNVTGLTSDDFKFHLRKLVKLGLVTKTEDGIYILTAEGKEFANRFDYDNQKPIRQPKMTTATYVHRTNPGTGASEYLFHQRLRQPFYEYWGIIGRPVRWGESFETAATIGLAEQTGLSAPLRIMGFYRQRDTSNGATDILEDKLFVVFEAEWQGDELHNWPHARAKWMTAKDLAGQPKRFDSCVDMLNLLQSDQLWFKYNDTSYSSEDF
jgi:ADP-ribose pyrophosphatase YjhB (NUDIX family)